MPPSRIGRSEQRRNQPQSPRKQLAPTTSPKQTRRSVRSQSRELEPVPRQQQGLDNELQPVIEEQQSPELGANEPEPSQEASISVLTQGTQSEFQNLDVDDILEALPDLQDGAEKLIRFFNRNDDQLEQFMQELHSGTAVSKTFGRRMKYFLESRATFGNRLFITPEVIDRKLQGPMGADETWKPDAVLYLANVAFFLSTVFTGDDERKDELFQNIYAHYPAHFMSIDAQSTFTTQLVEETIAFGNEFRTQFFILMAKQRTKEGAFEPDTVLRELFRNEEDPLSFRGLTIAGVDAKQHQALIEERMRAIRQFFTKNPRSPVKLVGLQQAFPPNDFIVQCVQWCNMRSQELESQIEDQDGADGIVERLSQIKRGDDIDLGVAEPVVAAPRSAQAQKKSWGKNNANIARLKALSAANAARLAEADTESQSDSQSVMGDIEYATSGIDQDDELQNPTDMDGEEVANMLPTESDKPLQSNHAILAKLALIRHNEANQARENRRFLDPQPGAQRLTFDGPDTQTSPARSKTKGKRPATAESEDNDFENDTRQAPAKRARFQSNIDPRLQSEDQHALPDVGATPLDGDDLIPSQPSMPPPTPPPHRASLTAKSRGRLTNTAGALPSSSAPPAAQTARSPMSSPAVDSRSGLDLSGSQHFRLVQQLAKDATRRKKLPPSTAPEARERNDDDDNQLPTFTQRAERAAAGVGYQERKQWTPVEEQRLIDFIGVHGPAYSKILKEDSEFEDAALRNSLQGRNQVQLKDKARNIKFAYLKSGEPLPQGFGAVSIGKVMVDKLRAMGVDIEASQSLPTDL